jgi:hypothetical protein
MDIAPNCAPNCAQNCARHLVGGEGAERELDVLGAAPPRGGGVLAARRAVEHRRQQRRRARRREHLAEACVRRLVHHVRRHVEQPQQVRQQVVGGLAEAAAEAPRRLRDHGARRLHALRPQVGELRRERLAQRVAHRRAEAGGLGGAAEEQRVEPPHRLVPLLPAVLGAQRQF